MKIAIENKDGKTGNAKSEPRTLLKLTYKK